MSTDKKFEPEHEDLEKDLQLPGDEYVNMEGENHSTAAEGTLKTPGNSSATNHDDVGENVANEAAQRKKEAREDATKKTSLKQDETLDTDEVSS